MPVTHLQIHGSWFLEETLLLTFTYVIFVALSTTSQVPSISITLKRSQTSKRPISPVLSNSGKRIKCLFLILGWTVPLGWCPTCTKLTKQKVEEDMITLRDRSCQYYQIVTSYIKTKSRLVTSKTFFTDINMTRPQNPACSCFSSMQLFWGEGGAGAGAGYEAWN